MYYFNIRNTFNIGICGLYQYYFMPNIINITSYFINRFTKIAPIKFASGIVCLNFINQMIVNITNNELIRYYSLIYYVSNVLLYLHIFELYIKTISAGIDTICNIVKYCMYILSNLTLLLNTSQFNIFINTLDQSVGSVIESSNQTERELILERLRIISHKIIIRLVQIEFMDHPQNELQTFEDFILSLNDHYPLRCRGLNNTNNNRIESDICNVCLDNLNYNELYRTINCSHSFHPHCIDRWLFQSKCCPICRTVINLGSSNNTN